MLFNDQLCAIDEKKKPNCPFRHFPHSCFAFAFNKICTRNKSTFWRRHEHKGTKRLPYGAMDEKNQTQIQARLPLLRARRFPASKLQFSIRSVHSPI